VAFGLVTVTVARNSATVCRSHLQVQVDAAASDKPIELDHLNLKAAAAAGRGRGRPTRPGRVTLFTSNLLERLSVSPRVSVAATESRVIIMIGTCRQCNLNSLRLSLASHRDGEDSESSVVKVASGPPAGRGTSQSAGPVATVTVRVARAAQCRRTPRRQ
jgi:hypothetical protein